MRLVEYRIVLPMSVDEYQMAQLYSVAEMSKNETGGGNGVNVIANEPFRDHAVFTDSKGLVFKEGQYTDKVYHMQHKMPKFLQLLAPANSLSMYEKAWNAYPYCRTFYENGYMKDNFTLRIESLHLPDRGTTENAHNLPPERLKKREIVHIDIANDPIKRSDYKPEFDPANFLSKKTGRGHLKGDWIKKVEPVMTCYKLVTIEFKWFGLQNKVENFIVNQERRLFTVFHRQMFCQIDDWFGMTMDDIRRIEAETKEALERQIKDDQRRGMTTADDE